MCDYELVAIVSPEANEETIAGRIDGVSQLIVGRHGVVEETQRWGKKRLAYPIKKFMEGNYALFRFKLEPSYVLELRQTLEADESILRYLVIKKGK